MPRRLLPVVSRTPQSAGEWRSCTEVSRATCAASGVRGRPRCRLRPRGRAWTRRDVPSAGLPGRAAHVVFGGRDLKAAIQDDVLVDVLVELILPHGLYLLRDDALSLPAGMTICHYPFARTVISHSYAYDGSQPDRDQSS